MTSLKDRFALLAKEHPEITQADLARATGARPPSVSAWFSGDTKSMKAETAAKAAALYGCTPMWLATGVGPRKPTSGLVDVPVGTSKDSRLSQTQSNVADAPDLIEPSDVPVVGHVKAGHDGYLEEMEYPVGHGEGYVPAYTNDPSAYALRVKGDSMHPRYRANEFIVVTPGIEAQPSDDVVVNLKDGRKLLKQLNWVRDGEVQLISINNGYAPHTLSFSEIESIHLVADRVRAGAFRSDKRPRRVM